MLLGAHMSVAGGLDKSFAAGIAVGCDCMQIFVRNQRQWHSRALSSEQTEAFRRAQEDTGIRPVVAHASYLINLASPDLLGRERSINAMVDELQRCEVLGIESLVVHPGSYVEGGVACGVERVGRSIGQIHKRTRDFKTMILLETTAGQGTSVGHRFDQLAEMIAGTEEPDRLGVCLDTCHLFAAGYDFRSAEGYAALLAELDETVGLRKVRCIHLNDSKRELGSRVDRHEHIGKGKIGKRGFAHFMNDARWIGVSMILETPKGKDGRGTDFDKVNLKRLRALVQDE